MSSRQRLRAAAMAAVVVLIAASCGDDDDGGASGTTAAGESEAADTTAAAGGAETTEPADAAETTEGGDTTEAGPTTEGSDSTEEPAGEGDIDSLHGQGASAFQAAMDATADDTIGGRRQPASRSSSASSTSRATRPARSPTSARVPRRPCKLVNERLGGIGADIEAGTGGRTDRAGLLRPPRRPERGAGVRQPARRRQPEHDHPRRRLLHAADVPTVHRLPGGRDAADLHRRLRPARRVRDLRRLRDGLPVERRAHRRGQGPRPPRQ